MPSSTRAFILTKISAGYRHCACVDLAVDKGEHPFAQVVRSHEEFLQAGKFGNPGQDVEHRGDIGGEFLAGGQKSRSV